MPSPIEASGYATSPQILAHASFTSLAIHCSNAANVCTLEVAVLRTGPWDIGVTLEGSGKVRMPASGQEYKLVNAGYVRLTWTLGTVQIFQKG